jgi:hypothetical protein
MTFSELMKATYCMQPVRLMLGEESISGGAEALDCYLADEVTKAEVEEINIEDNVMKVWVKA